MFGFNQQPNNGATGGLFGGGGNNNTQGGGGLFGGGAMGGAGGAGQSLFGGQSNPVSSFGNNNNNNQGGGLFGGGQQNAPQVGGGLFGGGQQQQQQQQNNGGGLFGGGGGGGGLFGGPTSSNNNNQPSPFSLNGPQQGNGGLFGGATQNTGGGLFGGGGQAFGQNQPNTLGGNNNGMGGQTAQFGGFGGGMQQQQQGGGLFGNNPNTGGQGQQAGGLFGGPVASTGGGLFGGQQQTPQLQSGGGLFGQPAQTNNAGGGLFGMANNNTNTTSGLFGGAANSGGGLLGGGFNMGNNNGGLLGGLSNNNQGNAGFGFNNQMAGSFGQNNNNGTAPFVAKKSVNESLSSKPNEKNLVYSISNGSDKCILELALIQRKMVKAGQLQPNPQGAMGQNLGQPQQQGGLFGGNQNMQQPGAVGGGLFGAAPQQQQGGLFGGQTAGSSQPLGGGGGGLFGQPKVAQAVSFGGLFGQNQQNTSGVLLVNTAGGGGLFGGATQAPSQSGGLFGGAGLGQQQAPATGGGLFGGQPTQQAGGLFGGQTQQPAQGGLFGAQQSTSSTGGLFGGPTAAPAQNTGFSLGGTSSTTGGLFGNSTANTQQGGLFGGQTQTTGGLFGASAQPTGGLFGQTAPSGGLFGNANTSTTQTGGQFGQLPLPTQGLQFGGAGPQNFDSIGGYQSLLRFLEATNFQEQKKPILDEDIEARWVYGKSRDSDSLGYYQKREGDKQGESAYTANEYQCLYGYSQKQKVLSQFKNLALKDENDRKEDIKKTLSAFTGGNKSEVSSKLKTQSNMSSRIPAKSERLSSSTLGANPQEFTQQMEYCLDFIKSGSKSRVKIPFKPRYTYGDVKNYILEQIIDTDATLEGVRSFRLQARLKEANQPPKPLKENENILASTVYSSIDYIELVEKAGNLTSSLNNSVAFGQNLLEASQLSEKNNQENDDKIAQNSSSSAAPVPKKFTIPSEFKTSPSISVLEKLGDSALQRVENFSIENSFVKIAFEEPINLLNADLTGLFFGENKISIEDVPSGDRINKPCIIQFTKFGQKQLDNKKTPLEVQNLVEKLVSKMKLDLVKPYDVKNTCLIYRQESFN